MLSRVFFANERFRDGELPKDSSLSAWVSTLSGAMGPGNLLGIGGRYLARLFQDRYFFQSRPATGHSHAISAQLDLATPSYVLLVPIAFSPCLDAN